MSLTIFLLGWFEVSANTQVNKSKSYKFCSFKYEKKTYGATNCTQLKDGNWKISTCGNADSACKLDKKYTPKKLDHSYCNGKVTITNQVTISNLNDCITGE